VSIFDTYTVTISVSAVDLLALKKMTIVAGALSKQFAGKPSGPEMELLTRTLLDLVNKIEVEAHAK